MKRRRGTRTSAFGSPGRISHDSSGFYRSRLFEGIAAPNEGGGGSDAEQRENSVPAKHLNRLFCKSSERMEELPDASVHLMVTSPPYNVGKEYDGDLTLAEHRALLSRVWAEVRRVLLPGGRACINVANLGRKPYLPIHAYIAEDMASLGFLMRGEVIWDKGGSGSPSTAWGSWRSARNPTLRDVHEYILIFSKGSYSLPDRGRRSTISRDEFLEFTKSVWAFPAEPARRVGHPAPFPVELPYRLIQLYTFEGDVVLDPFIGSGQTALAARRSGRHFVGYDTSEEYIRLARKRLAEAGD